MVGVGASHDYLITICTLLRRGPVPKEVAVEDPVEEYRVHAEDDGDARTGHREEEERQGVLVNGEPARHPAKQHDPK